MPSLYDSNLRASGPFRLPSEVTPLPFWVIVIIALVAFLLGGVGLAGIAYIRGIHRTSQYNEKLRLQQEEYERRLLEVQEHQRDVLRETKEPARKTNTPVGNKKNRSAGSGKSRTIARFGAANQKKNPPVPPPHWRR